MKQQLSELSNKLKRIIDKYHLLKKGGGEVICILSGKGGVGKTTLVINIGSSLALKNKKVLLIDLNFALPTLHLFLGEKTEVTMTHYLAGISDLENIVPGKIKLKSGEEVSVIPSESLVNLGERIDVERLGAAINHFRLYFDYIFLDVGPGMSKYSLYPITVSDRVFIVSVDEWPAYKDAMSVKKMIKSMGSDDDGFILNMVKTTNPSKLKHRWGDSIFGVIPYDKHLKLAFQNGEPIFNYKLSFLSKGKKYIDRIAEKIIFTYSITEYDFRL
jgi:MinD-like ATPase involved in chromosome partitioning or flagellar assembly